MATFESLVRLKQIYEQDISGYILEVVSGVITGAAFNSGSLVGMFYPYSQNPAGYITSGQTGQFATSVNLGQTGATLLSYMGATYYPNTNPLSFLNISGLNSYLATGTFGTAGIQWIDSVSSGVVLQFLPAQSFELSGQNSVIQLYNTLDNPDGSRPYISGFDVWAYNINCTGINNQPILTSGAAVGMFVPFSKFTRGQAGQGFNYFLLTDSTNATTSLFDAGNNFYFQGRNQTGVSLNYMIDLYGNQASNYSLPSGAPFILGFDLYSNKIEQNGYRVLTTNDISATGLVLSGSMLAMSGYFQTNENRLTTLLNNYMLSGISGAYPLVGNPSGFLTPSATGTFVPSADTVQVYSGYLNLTGWQYPWGLLEVNFEEQSVIIGDGVGSVNNTFITLNDWSKTIQFNAQDGYAFGGTIMTLNGNQVVTANETGSFVTSNQTGHFYPSSNPSNFIPLSQVGGVRQLYVSGTPISGNVGFTTVGGSLVYLSGNYIVFSGGAGGGTATGTVNLVGYQSISGFKDFSSGIAVLFISGINGVIGLNQPNPNNEYNVDINGTIGNSSGTYPDCVINVGSGLLSSAAASVDWENALLIHAGNETVDWGDSYLVNPNTTNATLDWVNCLLIDNTSNNSIDWVNRLLVMNSSSLTSIDWQNQYLMLDGQPVIQWAAGLILDNNVTEGGIRSVDYFNRLLQAPVGGESASYYTTIDWVNQILSGKSWTINNANFVSGLTVSGVSVSTGNVNTGSLTGVFITSTQTGNLTGAFYPYHSNPSGYVTSSQTGSFATNTGYLTMGAASVNIPSTTVINWNLSNTYYYLLSGSITFSFTGPTDGRCIVVAVTQPSGQNYSVAWPSSTVSGIFWPYGVAPTQSSGFATDIYTFIDITGAIYGNVVQNFLN